ncbi:MAG: hypothetical protein ACREF7_02795, partial [Candidatus Saccharimonadales bacterium]
MNVIKRISLIGALSLVIFGAVTPSVVLGATAPSTKGSGQALEIAPPLLEVSGNPGQTISAKIYLRDISSVSLV